MPCGVCDGWDEIYDEELLLDTACSTQVLNAQSRGTVPSDTDRLIHHVDGAGSGVYDLTNDLRVYCAGVNCVGMGGNFCLEVLKRGLSLRVSFCSRLKYLAAIGPKEESISYSYLLLHTQAVDCGEKTSESFLWVLILRLCV